MEMSTTNRYCLRANYLNWQNKTVSPYRSVRSKKTWLKSYINGLNAFRQTLTLVVSIKGKDMNVVEFVSMWKEHAEDLFKDYTCGDGQTAVSKLFLTLDLNADEKDIFEKMIECILVDTHYTFLIGLDGSANIGGVQQDYKLYDEKGNLVYEAGDLEAEAYEQFQENFLK